MPTLHLLWDSSSLWGLLAVRAVSAYGIPYKIVRASEIAEGILEKEKPSMLLVPGGSAKGKSKALGESGREAIRSYVANGGHYFGICGGAGLALSWKGESKRSSLALCPWQRGKFKDPMQHFMSGHINVNIPGLSTEKLETLSMKENFSLGTETSRTNNLLLKNTPPTSAAIKQKKKIGEGKVNDSFPEKLIPKFTADRQAELMLPVWWPSRFDAEENNGVTVLARYAKPGPDFWLTDLPINRLPSYIFDSWRDLYGFSISPNFLEGQPCVIHGDFGKGSYTLSYSHLETPASPFANSWLAHFFRVLGGLAPVRDITPPWDIKNEEIFWDDPALEAVEKKIEAVAQVGLDHGLFFQRNEWLFGWRSGIPGSSLNYLLATIQVIRRTPPCEKSKLVWEEIKKDIIKYVALFHQASVDYLLAERLAQTIAKNLPDIVPQQALMDQRDALFGAPMHPGGFYNALMEPLENLAFVQLRAKN